MMKKKRSAAPAPKFGFLLRNIGIALAAFLLLFVLLVTGITPDQYDIRIGQPAAVTVYATKDVEDAVTTQQLREAASAAVEPSYKSVDKSVNSVVLAQLQSGFESLRKTAQSYAKKDSTHIQLESFNREAALNATQESYEALLGADDELWNALVTDCTAAVRDTMNSTLPEGQESAAVLRIQRVLNASDYPSGLTAAAAEIVRASLRPNMLIDEEITQANRDKASEEIEPVVIVKREVIVRQGEIVSEAEYQMIASLGLLADDSIDYKLYGGIALLLLLLFGVIALYLRQFRPEVLKDSAQLALLAIAIVAEMAVSLPVRSFSSYLMPVALGVMLIAQLVDGRTALFVNALLAFPMSMLVASDSLFSTTMFTVMLMGLAAGPLITYIFSKSQVRTSMLLAGFAIGAMNFVIVIAMTLISSLTLNSILSDAFWAFGSGLFSAVLALGLQSLLEWVFNLATNARLIELSNPNHPLLRKLLLEAPGTYHHSIIVANLAEAAATQIGANGLLARVGAYYHDIGKLKRPMYFKENQLGDNPHDRTDPRVSAAILTAHPRDGAQMAQKERLPARVIDIVRSHHGDTMVVFFYDKAVKLYGEDTDPAAFRYEGLRPRSKEAAVVMLADTIEAATRAQKGSSPEKMEELIRKLIRGKMDDGQLNESALTFADLEQICATFCTVLTGVFHERIEYPDIELPPRKAQTAEAAAEEKHGD